MLIDLRSDTVTVPTPEMRRAMAEAPVGDDVYGDDPTVNELQDLAAEMLGKEAALFVCSGTMGNQVALMTHTRRGDEILVERDSHVFNFEAGAAAVLSGVQPRTVTGDEGFITVEVLADGLRPGMDVHLPPTTLVCLENSHNWRGGRVMTAGATDEVCNLAHSRGVRVHLDGARLFNAAVALGVPARDLVRGVDSVMICLSKGLSCPMGSLLLGSKDVIERARRFRKMVGGGLRQAGVVAACGIVALRSMVDRLAIDHENARLLAGQLNDRPGLTVDLESVQTNIVMVDVDSRLSARVLVDRMRTAGVLANAVHEHRFRLVAHKDVDRSAMMLAVDRIADIVAKW